ncbi:MAG: response regulator [Ktedonobacterales bacterium]|nr:response regulator [Ktedonobacterales bacterium]
MMQALVVDDDKDTRDVLRLILEDVGYTVEEARDGVQTLEALQSSDIPLVVLLDLDLPQLDGIEVLHAVARDPRLAARHAFILLTAVSHRRYQAAEEVCAILSVPLILKPFGLDVLLDAVATAALRLPSMPEAQGDQAGR